MNMSLMERQGMAKGGRLGIDQGLKRGLRFGLKKGLEEGKEDGTTYIAILMMAKVKDLDLISEIIDLPLPELKDLFKKSDEHAEKLDYMQEIDLIYRLDWQEYEDSRVQSFSEEMDRLFDHQPSAMEKEWLDFLEEERAAGADYVAIMEEQGIKKGKILGRKRGLEKGFEIGYQRGLQQGIEKVVLHAISKMLERGLLPQEISDLLDLPIEEIEDIQ